MDININIKTQLIKLCIGQWCTRKKLTFPFETRGDTYVLHKSDPIMNNVFYYATLLEISSESINSAK